MWIALSGAESTGKTTLANNLASRLTDKLGCSIQVHTGQARKAASRGHLIGEKCTPETYAAILQEHMRSMLESKADIVIWDRTPLDVAAYIEVNGSYIPELKGLALILARMIARRTALHFYTPIEFPLVADGVRGVSEAYRRKVDASILRNFTEAGIQYHAVSGTPKIRVARIEELFMMVKGQGDNKSVLGMHQTD